MSSTIEAIKIHFAAFNLAALMRCALVLCPLAALCFGQSPVRKARIMIQANGYSIDISPDGSGVVKLFEGSAALSSASALLPPAAVDFAALKAILETEIAKPRSSPRPHYQVVAGVKADATSDLIMKPIENIDVWNALIDQVEAKLTGPYLMDFREAAKKRTLKIVKP